jgi:hypothetical protein
VGRVALVAIVVLLFSAIAWIGYSLPSTSAGLRVASIGEPHVVSITIDPGICDPLSLVVVEQFGRIAYTECGAKAKKGRIVARCADAQLPAAVVDYEFELGSSSNYVEFRDVCSSSREQIEAANSTAKAIGTTLWRGSAL